MSNAADLLEIPATVPAAFRRMLGFGKSGHIVFRGLADGTVGIAKADLKADGDVALGPFLTLPEQDPQNRLYAVEPVSEVLYRRAASLVEGIDVDLDAALPDDEA